MSMFPLEQYTLFKRNAQQYFAECRSIVAQQYFIIQLSHLTAEQTVLLTQFLRHICYCVTTATVNTIATDIVQSRLDYADPCSAVTDLLNAV